MQPDSAHEIHDVMCANAAANLDYPSVIVYPNQQRVSFNILNLLKPFNPQPAEQNFINFFNVQEKLKVAPLPVPWFSQYLKGQRINFSTLLYKYYFPFHLFPYSKLIHTRDWNCVEAAVRNKIPVIYERHYFQDTSLKSDSVQSPYLKIAITQSEPVRQSLIEAGMPASKTVWMHNGFSPAFLERRPEEAQAWREQLLKEGRKHLVVYSGALYKFKGIEVLIDAAQELPELQFAITGGTEEQIDFYRQLVKDKQVKNVQFLGWILPRSRLISILQAADILAHPHCSGKSANFTNPVKFFQYIGSGTPLVITEIPPLMMFKSAPIAATWCEPDNPIAFAQAVQHTIKTYPRKIEGYSENTEFARQFTWEERTRKILRSVEMD